MVYACMYVCACATLYSYAIIQVYKRLQKSMLTLSSRATLNLLDKLGQDHDAPVLTWTKSLQPRLEAAVHTEQVGQYKFMVF